MERIPSGATRVIFGIALALCCGCASFERDNRYALGLRRNYSTERQLRLLQAVVRNQQSELESIRERNSVLEQRLTKRRQSRSSQRRALSRSSFFARTSEFVAGTKFSSKAKACPCAI